MPVGYARVHITSQFYVHENIPNNFTSLEMVCPHGLLHLFPRDSAGDAPPPDVVGAATAAFEIQCRFFMELPQSRSYIFQNVYLLLCCGVNHFRYIMAAFISSGGVVFGELFLSLLLFLLRFPLFFLLLLPVDEPDPDGAVGE